MLWLNLVRNKGRRLPVLCLTLPILLSGQSIHQTQEDDYTRYELLDPQSQSFRITYDVTATAAGTELFFNAIRIGSEPTVHDVYDLATGRKLDWSVVDGEVARRDGLARANPEGQYILVRLARPVPQGGGARIRIVKTYKDPESYFQRANKIIFSRALGIKRNSVILPPGYELTGCNHPSQIDQDENGRIKISFMNPGPSAVPLRLEGCRLPKALPSKEKVKNASKNTPPAPASSGYRSVSSSQNRARVDYLFSERAFQDREIVYFLEPPETHSFRLYHDYTESREGIDRYLNIVRSGSKATNPSAMNLDTGEKLKVETLRGQEIVQHGIDLQQTISEDTEVVVIWFDPVKKGQSVRLRILETYTDPNRYLRHGEELIWDRSFGRPRNTVVLPAGWYVTANAVPAIVSQMSDGRIRMVYMNDRPGSIDVFIKARHR